MDDYPKFIRRENENISLLTKRFDEFGDEQITERIISEKTAKRMLEELSYLAGKTEYKTKKSVVTFDGDLSVDYMELIAEQGKQDLYGIGNLIIDKPVPLKETRHDYWNGFRKSKRI